MVVVVVVVVEVVVTTVGRTITVITGRGLGSGLSA